MSGVWTVNWCDLKLYFVKEKEIVLKKIKNRFTIRFIFGEEDIRCFICDCQTMTYLVCPRIVQFGGQMAVAMYVCPRIVLFGGHVAVAMYVCPRKWQFGGQIAVAMYVCPRIVQFGGQTVGLGL